jgi:DNA polymerase III subunit epsilon
MAIQPRFEDLGCPLIATTFVVVDLETTGLRPTVDRITEIGAVKVRGGEVLGELRTFVHPGRPIPAAVTAVTGITDAMVRGAPTIDQVLPSLRTFLGDAVFVAHNAPFDLGFLRAAVAEHGDGGALDPVVVDTARLARRLLRDEVRDLRLATLARHLRSRTAPEHRALSDARATVDVLHGLIERAGTLGATTLEDLRDLARSTSDKRFRRISLVHDAPSSCGVYRFLDARGEVLYVGKATDLRTRLRSYFGQDRRRRIDDLIRETARVTWTPTATLIEAEVREVREIHRHLPRYNRRSKRTPAPAHLAVTREPFPRLSIVAAPRDTHRATLGPLPSRRVTETLVAAWQTWLPLRTCTDRLRVRQDHAACLMKDLGNCGAPCDGTQSRADHERLIERVDASFRDPTPVLVALRRRMEERAAAGRFEEAGELRGQLHTVARTLLALRRRLAIIAVPELVLARDLGATTQVLVLRSGRLAASLCLEAVGAAPAAAGRGDQQRGADELVVRVREQLALTPLEAPAEPPTARDTEEIDLLLRWIDEGHTRLLWATAGYAEPCAGGSELAAVAQEARRVARAVHRDRQALSGAKVSRRERVQAT